MSTSEHIKISALHDAYLTAHQALKIAAPFMDHTQRESMRKAVDTAWMAYSVANDAYQERIGA